jgi:hypothetical protein
MQRPAGQSKHTLAASEQATFAGDHGAAPSAAVVPFLVILGVGVLLWFVSPFRGVWAVGAMIAIFGLGHVVAWALSRRSSKPASPPA